MDQHFESFYPERVRFSDLEKLAKFIKEGTSAQLLSIPGVGRSTVLGLLAHNKKVRQLHFGLDNNIHFVLVNFQEVRQKSSFEVLEFIFLSIIDSLRVNKPKEYQKVSTLLRNSLKLNDELVLFQALKEAIEYLSFEKSKRIVLLFDKFEEFVPSVTSEFFTSLRTLRTRFKYQFSCVFSLNRPLEDLLEQSTLADFYEYVGGHHVYLELYDKVTTDFRVKYIEKITEKKLTTNVFKKIVEEIGGVGRLMKLSVEAVLASGEKLQIASTKSQINFNKQTLEDFLFSQKSIQNVLNGICGSLLPVEQTCLIKNQFEDKNAVDYLEKVGIIRDRVIQIPLFAKHIQAHAKDTSDDEKKIIYSESTNIIKKGEKIISDQLTSSEFKLLSYLVQSPVRIINRDEIIEVVWSDQISTAGITDQAVDQLIFRLRRKIEDDPNNPIHLQTVKGRGFRFNP